MPVINPEIIRWARETAGLTLEEAAAKIRIVEQNLAKIESGKSSPSRATLVRMAKQYRRPLLVFYLDRPPRKSDYGADFRSLSPTLTRHDEALLLALLRNVKARQQMVRAIMEEEESPLPFVGWLTRKRGLPIDTDLLEHELKNMQDAAYEALVQDALDGLESLLGPDSSPDTYYAQSDARVAFNLLRSCAENAGVFVILQDNLGNHRSKLSLTLFRALVISDNIAPFIVINSQDALPARSFSVLHELVHLLLGQTGVSDSSVARPIETFCNKVAGEWLLPSGRLRGLSVDKSTGLTGLVEAIAAFAQAHNLSHTMIATRLVQQEIITSEAYSALRDHYEQTWKREQERKKAQLASKKSKPVVSYSLRRQRLGNNTIQFATRMIASGELTVTKAATILAVKPSQVFRLLSASADS